MTSEKKYTIDEHWDTGGNITADSDPQEEFDIWIEYVASGRSDWGGNEFMLSDFEEYIEKLKAQ